MMNTPYTVPTRYWHSLDDGRVQCDLCPRKCRLHEGQRGLCYVRCCQDHQIKLTTYGRSSGFCIDPIEKKPLNHFLPGSPVLSLGTVGCNLACKFCQNWSISKARREEPLQQMASPDAIVALAKRYQCDSVAFTYNDPVIFFEYMDDIASACRLAHIKTVAVTAGYIMPEPRVAFFANIDATNIDLKSFNEHFYFKLTGSHLQPVLETLEYVAKETSTWLEITTLLIPGENDSEAEIASLSAWVMEHLGADVPLHFSAFHPDWRMQDHPPTPLATLKKARDIAISTGLNFVYTGNLHYPAGERTYCAACKALLIQRNRYVISAWHLTESGCCPECGTPCPGVFTSSPKHWGRKRLAVFP